MNDEVKQYLQPGKKNLILMYILYLCGVVMPLFPLVGMVVSSINREVGDKVLASHYLFLLRTFGLGLIGFIISYIIPLAFINILLYIVVSLWFILRVSVGLKYLVDNLAHPNPLTFWIK